MSRCAILKSAVKPKMPADAAIEIADALKAAKDGRLPSNFYGEATGNLGDFFLTNFLVLIFGRSGRTRSN